MVTELETEAALIKRTRAAIQSVADLMTECRRRSVDISFKVERPDNKDKYFVSSFTATKDLTPDN